MKLTNGTVVVHNFEVFLAEIFDIAVVLVGDGEDDADLVDERSNGGVAV